MGNLKYNFNPATQYKNGYNAGNNDAIEMILKVVMLSLYAHEWPATAMMEMRNDIMDAIFFYRDNPDKLDLDMKTMEEESGIRVRFTGKAV